MFRKIVLFISILFLIIGISGIFCITMKIDIINLINLKKTTTCTKKYIDEGNTITDVMKITYNNKILKVINTNTTEYSDTTYIDMTYSFGSLIMSGFNEINGINTSYNKINNNTIQLIMTIDYQKLDYNDLKNKINDSTNINTFYQDTDISFKEFKNKYLTEYICS